MLTQKSQIKKLVERKKIFLFDLDGTLYLGSKRIPGALELVKRLSSSEKRVFYFTNNSSRSEKDYVQKLRKMGFPAQLDQVVMSTHSLIHGLQQRSIKRVFLLGTPSMRRMLLKAGIRHLEKNAQAVVVGFDKTLTYQRLLTASRMIHQKLPYFVTHPDYFCPTEKGPEPDCGSIALLLEKTTGVKPQAVFGKPNPLMFKPVLKRANAKKKEMLLIGDRLMTDIAMAKNFAVDSIMVLSGDSKKSDLKGSKIKPTALLQSVKELL